MDANGAMFDGNMLWYILLCFLVNYVIIYRGVTKGIEKFCKIAMPLLIGCALIILIRVLTLPNEVDGRTINHGLGFMWNPDWAKFAKTANEYQSAIRVLKDGLEVNGKSIMGIMMLAAAQGNVIQVEAEGPDEKQAIRALGELIENRFEEE